MYQCASRDSVQLLYASWTGRRKVGRIERIQLISEVACQLQDSHVASRSPSAAAPSFRVRVPRRVSADAHLHRPPNTTGRFVPLHLGRRATRPRPYPQRSPFKNIQRLCAPSLEKPSRHTDFTHYCCQGRLRQRVRGAHQPESRRCVRRCETRETQRRTSGAGK